jgi:hypothetical protein
MYSKSKIPFSYFIFLALFVALPVFAVDIVSPPETVTVSASVGLSTSTPNDNSGGGSVVPTSVVFSGYAYPLATVHIWKDGTPKKIVTADEKGYFIITLNETYNPSVLYTLYAVDKSGGKSLLLNYPLVIKTGYLTQVSGLRFAPTVAIDKTEVKVGDYLSISGYAIPNASIDLTIDGSNDAKFYLESNNEGIYKITIPMLDLKKGDYNLHVNYKNDNKISKVLKFTIGDINILSIDLTTNIPGDCNADQVINLIDFSVVAFWYGKANPPRCVDSNSDNVINLIDFSILAFYWTG